MSEESDIELRTALPKKKKVNKPPKSPTQDILPKNQEEKKLTTKEMINQALTDMKSRKGTSLYAIKKYIEEKFHVDVEKIKYIIKKSIKDGVEGGTIVQTKGIGATGSFRLVATQKNKKSEVKKDKNPKEKLSKKKVESKDKKSDKKVLKSKNKIEKKVKDKLKDKKHIVLKEKTKKSVKIAKGLQTPAKKKSAMMKRKSIGSIIKPPKMRPKAKIT